MAKLAAPYVSKTGGRSKASPFNEFVSIPKAQFAKEAARDPALNSKNSAERAEAWKASVQGGALKKYRVT